MVLFVFIQILFYNSVPNQIAYSFSVEIPEHEHYFKTDEEIYEFFRNEEDWETSRSEKWVKIEALEEDDKIWAFLRLESEGVLTVGGGRRFFYDTRGPPLHPRAVGENESFEKQTIETAQDILSLLDVNVEDEFIEAEWMSFGSLWESWGANLFFISYFILLLIVSCISVITINPLIPSNRGRGIDIFTRGLWYVGLIILFFFMLILIRRAYMDSSIKFEVVGLIIGSGLMILGVLETFFS